MDEKTPGSAGPALAAHSKDASTPGPTQASSATGNQDWPAAGGVSETVNRVSGQAREAAERLATSASEAASTATRQLSEQGGRAADQVAEFVREQPLTALLATGAVCFALGVLVARA